MLLLLLVNLTTNNSGIEFKDISPDLPFIVQLYEYSRIPDKKSWTLDEICKKLSYDSQFDKDQVSSLLKQILNKLRLKGAVDFNDELTDIRLYKIKLCLLTTNPEMSEEELTRRSHDFNEDCCNMNLF